MSFGQMRNGLFYTRHETSKTTDSGLQLTHTHNVVECEKAYIEKAMASVGIVRGINPPALWFETSANSDVYLETVLTNSVWHAVRAVATIHQ